MATGIAKKALSLKSMLATGHHEESLPLSGFTGLIYRQEHYLADTHTVTNLHTHVDTHTGLFQDGSIDSTGTPAADNS